MLSHKVHSAGSGNGLTASTHPHQAWKASTVVTAVQTVAAAAMLESGQVFATNVKSRVTGQTSVPECPMAILLEAQAEAETEAAEVVSNATAVSSTDTMPIAARINSDELRNGPR